MLLSLENDAQSTISGFDPAGNVVLFDQFPSFGCNAHGPCYSTWVHGVAVSASATLPTLAIPIAPSSGCAGIPSYIPSDLIAFAFCGGGRLIYGVDGRYTNPITNVFGGNGLFDGPDPIADKIGGFFPDSFSLSPASINSFGDVVFDDIGFEEIIEAYNVTAHAAAVPEPSALLLIATGAMAAAASARRRWLS